MWSGCLIYFWRLVFFPRQFAILQEQLESKTKELETLQGHGGDGSFEGGGRWDDSFRSAEADSDDECPSPVLEARTSVALAQFQNRQAQRVALVALRAWRQQLKRRHPSLASSSQSKLCLQSDRKPTTPFRSAEDPEPIQTYVRVKHSPRATPQKQRTGTPPFVEAENSTGVGPNVDSDAEPNVSASHDGAGTHCDASSISSISDATMAAADRACQLMHQRRALRRWKLHLSAQRHSELQTMRAYKHLFQRMMSSTLHGWAAVVRVNRRRRFLLQRAEAAVAEARRRRTALALRTWWRHATAAYYEQSIVQINLAADDAAKAVRVQLASAELARESAQEALSAANARAQAAEEATDRVSSRLKAVEAQSLQRLEALQQSRLHLQEAQQASSQADGELQTTQTAVLAARDRAASMARRAAEAEEQLAVSNLELDSMRQETARTVADLREQISTRDRRYDELLQTSALEREDFEAKIAELRTEIKNKRLGMFGAESRACWRHQFFFFFLRQHSLVNWHVDLCVRECHKI